MDDLRIHEKLSIPAAHLEASFSRSSGPGGQNVNKVNSKVSLRWHVELADYLSAGVLERLRHLAGSRWLDDGSLLITSQEHRDQAANLRACQLKLQQLVVQALQPPRPRRATRPTAGSQRRRVDAKVRRGQIKQGRRDSWD